MVRNENLLRNIGEQSVDGSKVTWTWLKTVCGAVSARARALACLNPWSHVAVDKL